MATRLTHKDARILVREGFRRQFARDPNRPEAQCAQAVAWLETGYGSGWHGPGVDSNNMGAIQAAGWHQRTFTYTDTHPNSDGTSTPYKIAFRAYDSAQDGMQDLVRVVYQIHGRAQHVLAPARKGDTLGFSAGLHATAYYEGFGKTVADRIANHHKAVIRAITLQALALREPMPDGSDAVPTKLIPATLRFGARGRAVQLLQGKLAVKVDGVFGKLTLAAVRAWQQLHGLKVDGIVGPATWMSLG